MIGVGSSGPKVSDGDVANREWTPSSRTTEGRIWKPQERKSGATRTGPQGTERVGKVGTMAMRVATIQLERAASALENVRERSIRMRESASAAKVEAVQQANELQHSQAFPRPRRPAHQGVHRQVGDRLRKEEKLAGNEGPVARQRPSDRLDHGAGTAQTEKSVQRVAL